MAVTHDGPQLYTVSLHYQRKHEYGHREGEEFYSRLASSVIDSARIGNIDGGQTTTIDGSRLAELVDDGMRLGMGALNFHTGTIRTNTIQSGTIRTDRVTTTRQPTTVTFTNGSRITF